MSDSFYYVLGFIAGLLLVFVVRLIVSKKRKTKCEYDERQLLARNSAYKTSFFTLVVYSIFCALMDIMEIKWAQLNVQMFIGVFISIGVFFTICIFKDAYFGYSTKNMRSFIILSIAVIAVNLFAFIMNVLTDEASIFTDGLLNQNFTNILVAGVFAIFLIVLIIKKVINKRTVEE